MEDIDFFLELIETIIEILLERGKNWSKTINPSESIDVYDYIAEKTKNSEKIEQNKP